jgi:SAM-dependent methyltransferase
MTELSDDVVAHRSWLLSLMPVRHGELIADLGCGAGHDLLALALGHAGLDARFVGLDASEKTVADAKTRSRDEPRLSFATHDLDRSLPFETASLDGVFTSNLLECLGEPALFAREIGRVLRPGGTVVAAHWDWDSQMFDGRDKSRVRRLMHAFADWQQPWMKHADGWMGRRLWGTFASTGLFEGAVRARTLTNTVFAAPWYGHARAQELHLLTTRALASVEDVSAFLDEQAALQAQGRYFYSITGMVYVGTRTP